MTGDILINLDSEDEGELFIGCAGGANTTAEFTYQPVSAPQDYFYFRVAVKGLTVGTPVMILIKVERMPISC